MKKKTAAWLGTCIALTATCEGVRQTAYRDVTGIPTICFGETAGVELGDHKTLAECKGMLEGRLMEFAAHVDACTDAEALTAKRKAAMVDFAYNVGPTAYCDRIAPLLNMGQFKLACDRLLLYNKAGGVVFPGLTKRREMERELCLADST